MRKLTLTFITAGLFMTSAHAQTLFTYGNAPVNKQEFLRVYQKNSINKAPDFSEKALREYLDLYSLFKMKVKEAEIQELDTVPNIARELDNYRKQIAKTYLTDEQVTNALVREAYERSKEEVEVAHILVSCPPTAMGPDTVAAYKKVDSLYKAITRNKADFAVLAKEFSDDKGTRNAGGSIGYITTLQTPFIFENAAYNTKPGQVSAPFRTQFGYHIVKVMNRRPARGEVRVAQILINVPQSRGQAGLDEGKKRADSVEVMLKKGTSFEELVAKYSDDKFTNKDKGVMAPFGVGRMSPAFEGAAFALKNPGDVSEPVQTEYGYHIIKLIEKMPPKPYDSVVTLLKRKVENDSRAQFARDAYFDKVKKKHGYKEYPANLEAVYTRLSQLPDTGKNAGVFKAENYKSMTAPVFELGNKKYSQADFITYAEMLMRGRITGPRKAVLGDVFRMYSSNVVNDYEEHQLVEENPDFKNLMEEYRNGIMLFELMDRNVWSKASRDTTGLKAYFEANKNKYVWEPGFTGTVYRFKDEAAKTAGMKLLNQKGGITNEGLVKQLNVAATPDAVMIQNGRYEFSKFTEVPASGVKKGTLSAPVKTAENSYVVVKADDVYTTAVSKTLDEARGYVVAEYQDYLEKEWNAQLRKKYPVKVEEQVFKSMVK